MKEVAWCGTASEEAGQNRIAGNAPPLPYTFHFINDNMSSASDGTNTVAYTYNANGLPTERSSILMFKKIFTLVLVFMMTVTDVKALTADYSKEENVGTILTAIVSYSNNASSLVTRSECIEMIMTVTGVSEQAAIDLATADYDAPIFSDVPRHDHVLDGYIVEAYFAGVALGVGAKNAPPDTFDPDRNATIRECLTFMLRCLKNPNEVSWESVMEDSVEEGLLTEEELISFSADDPLDGEQFSALLQRMLWKNRYLYWVPERPGYAPHMEVDSTDSIRYIYWLNDTEN